MVTIEEAQEQIRRQQQLIQQRRQEANQRAKQLEEAREKIKAVSAKQLRSQGLKGRLERRSAIQTQKAISKEEEKVKEYKKKLSQYQEQLQSTQKEVESQQREYDFYSGIQKYLEGKANAEDLTRRQLRYLQNMPQESLTIEGGVAKSTTSDTLKRINEKVGELKKKGYSEVEAYKALGVKVKVPELEELKKVSVNMERTDRQIINSITLPVVSGTETDTNVLNVSAPSNVDYTKTSKKIKPDYSVFKSVLSALKVETPPTPYTTQIGNQSLVVVSAAPSKETYVPSSKNIYLDYDTKKPIERAIDFITPNTPTADREYKFSEYKTTNLLFGKSLFTPPKLEQAEPERYDTLVYGEYKPSTKTVIAGSFKNIRRTYGKFFESGGKKYYTEEETFNIFQPSKIVSDIGQTTVITAPKKVGELFGLVSEEISPKAEIEISGSSFFQTGTKGTTTGPIEWKNVVTSIKVTKVAEFAGQIASYGVIGPTALTAGGFATAFGPAETYRTFETRGAGLFLGTLGAGIKGYQYLRKPIIKTEVIRPIKKPVAYEYNVNLKTGYRDVPLQWYRIKGEYSPPIKVTKTNVFKEVFNIKPKVTYLPAKVFSTESSGVVIGSEPYLSSTAVEGRYFSNLELIKGKSIPTDLTQFGKLTGKERVVWKNLAEEIAGRPVTWENVPSILKQDKTSLQVIMEKPIGRANIRTKTFTYEPKTTKTFLSGVQETGKIDFPAYSITRYEQSFKDITNPLARASGKPSLMTTFLVRQKEPIVIPEPSKIIIGGGKKTSFTKTFTEQVTKNVELLPKPIIKVPTTKTTTKIIGKDLPRMVGGTGAVSEYVGTGEYERTTGGMVVGDFTKLGEELEIKSSTTSGTVIETIPAQKIKQEIKPVISTKPFQVSGQKPITIQKTKPKLELKELIIQKLKTRQETILKTKQQAKAKTRPSFKPKPAIQPPIVTPKPKGLSSGRGLGKISKSTIDKFSVFVREKGKDVQLKEKLGLREAKQLLRKELTGTLRASGYITRGTELEKVRVNLGQGFRPSKVDPFRVVQKKRLRLGTRGETKEVQFFRKKSKKRGFL